MTVQQTSPPRQVSPDEAPTTITGVIDLLKAYAKQETVGPLRGAAKWLMWGVVGALCLALGLSMIVLGILRLVQAEWARSARGSFSWLAYLIALVVCVGFAALAFSRINRDSLNKEPK
jgi:hypothetical protein